MMTIVVTGGAGFIGGCLVRKLVAEGAHHVINLDALSYAANLDSLKPIEDRANYTFVKGSIGDRGLVREILTEHQPAAVINFAAESHVDRSIDGPRVFLETNVVGTFDLLSECLDYWSSLKSGAKDRFRFLHVSTDEVYGSLGESGRFTEQSPYSPNSPYSASKASSDHFVRAFHHTYGLPVLTTNCSNNYGPYQFPEKLIPLMILNALEGKPLPVYGNGENVRDWLFVEEHCEAIVAVLQGGRVGEVYNIGGDSERSNIEVVRAICRVVDQLRPDLPHRPCESLIQFVTDRPGHDWRYAIDASKIAGQLGWKPKVAFEEGIRQTVQWYLDNPEWIERIATGSYNRERLGLHASSGKPGGETGKTEASLGDRASHGESSASAHVGQRTDVDLGQFEPCEIADVMFRPLAKYSDQRGWLIELFREDSVPLGHLPVMCYVSETEPEIARGPHEHVDQSDCFGFMGPGDFELYLWDARSDSSTHGQAVMRVVGESNPQLVIIPPGIVHGYKNVSRKPGWVVNLPNRLYAGWGKKDPVDEIRHEDDHNSPYHFGE